MKLQKTKTEPRSARTPCLSALPRKMTMTLSIAHFQPIVALLAGVLILIVPRLLNYIVAFYLIVTGVIGLGLLH